MNILIVEDFRPVAKIFTEMFEQLGHKVVWVIGFQDKDVQNLRAISPEGDEVKLVADQFDLALVDGELQFGPNKDKDLFVGGPEVVGRLSQAGVTCVAISTMSDINQEMIQAGAVLAGQKIVAVLALVVGKLISIEDLQAPSAAVRQLLSRDLKDFRSDAEFPGLWVQGEELLVKHLKD
jgi:CheY-like chemotaxis protein